MKERWSFAGIDLITFAVATTRISTVIPAQLGSLKSIPRSLFKILPAYFDSE